MHNLRIQLLLSHLILVFLMVLVMVGAVYNFIRLGDSIDRILRNNYDSVIAAQNMKETLERQDSAATFLLAGQVEKARKQYEFNKPLFEKAFQVEAHNITEEGEQGYVDAISTRRLQYRHDIEMLLYANPPMETAAARAYYFKTLEPEFVQLKNLAQGVLDLNQKAIVKGDKTARAQARRASWTSEGVTCAALLLALFSALWMIRKALDPLRMVARQAEEIGAGHLNQRIDLRRADEIGALAEAFNRMAERLQKARRAEEERLHRAERVTDAALVSLYDPVIVTDARGRIVHLNRAAEGLFGPEERAAGMDVAVAIQDTRISEAVSRAVHHEHVSASEDEAGFVPIQVGGAARVYRLRTTPMRDDEGTLLGAVAVLEDVTHLRELDRLKTEFISVASHELRTPVTSLLLSVQLLQEGAVGELSPGQREVIDAQKEDLDRLDRMMRDLLEMARLEGGVTPPWLEIVPPRELVQGAVDAVGYQAEAKGIHLITLVGTGVPNVRADRAQVTRVLVNLLSNAVRHTPPGGTIRVDVHEAEDETERAQGQGPSVAFAVSDSGAGIPQDYLPRIFDRFVQVPGATRGGAGLGLSIAQTIVRAHGGTIKAESPPGEGSTFTFTLPE